MIAWIARRALAAFERKWGYDMTYARELLDGAGMGAIMPLDALTKIGTYRKNVPANVYYAAKIPAAVAADCGPCAQLVVKMAEAEKVPTATIRALIADDRDALSPEERLAYDLARATMKREPADEARAELLQRYGRAGLASLAYAMVAAEAYPTLKYALGHGHACVRLSVAGSDVARQPVHA